MAGTEVGRDDDLQERLSFVGLDADALALMRDLRPFLAVALEPAMDVFYERLAREPQLTALFKGEGGFRRARSRQMQHWGIMAEGGLDSRYAEGVRRIGEVHARIGLAPRWHIGGYAIILGHLIERLVHARLGEGARTWPLQRGAAAAPSRLAREIGVLVKATFVDMDLAISTYLEALEAARTSLEEERGKRDEAQNRMIGDLNRVLSAIESGDLTVRLGTDVPFGFRPMAETFDAAMCALSEALTRVQTTSSGLIQSAERIAGDTEKLAERTENQASSLEQSAAALHELTTSVASAADGATQAAESIKLLAERTRSSAEAAERASGAVQAIETSSSRISQITQVIDSLAFQTNLLSLNASIEAARAGEAGRGFAVVALEVRTLAQRCAEAASEINALLSESGRHVAAGVGLIAEMGDALREIAQRVGEANQTVGDIALSSREQAQGLREINEAVAQLETITQQNTAMVDQNRARSAELRAAAQSLSRDVGAFRTRMADPSRPAMGVASAA